MLDQFAFCIHLRSSDGHQLTLRRTGFIGGFHCVTRHADRHLGPIGEFDLLDLFDPGSPLRLEAPGEDIVEDDIVITTRRGINRAVDLPWRFYVRGSPGVSHRDREAEKRG